MTIISKNVEEKISECFGKIGDAELGNKILYEMCKSPHFDFDAQNILSSKLWLIGRSYAASPERKRKVEKDKEKRKDSIGDGTGKFLKMMAYYFLEGEGKEAYFDIENTIGRIKKEKYDYAFTNNDKELITQVVKTVKILNDLVKSASQDYDGGGMPDNQVSFCSKYLHFHCRNLIFIFDQFSFRGSSYFHFRARKNIGRNLCIFTPPKTTKAFPLEDFMGEYFVYRDTIKDKIIKLEEYVNKICGIDSNSDDNTIKALSMYSKHCIGSYSLGAFLKKNLSSIGDITPRGLDNLLLRIK